MKLVYGVGVSCLANVSMRATTVRAFYMFNLTASKGF